MTIDEYEALIAQGVDPEDINRPGGVHLAGLPNVGNGSPAFRNQKQRMAVEGLQRTAKTADAQEAPQRAIRRPFGMQAYSGANPMQQDFIDQFGPRAQARGLGGMIDAVQRAYQDENDSRVAQRREQARMQHEMDMQAMSQDALLQRLAVEQDESRKNRILQRQLAGMPVTKKFINGQWVDDYV